MKNYGKIVREKLGKIWENMEKFLGKFETNCV